jgi:hypothetical protein
MKMTIPATANEMRINNRMVGLEELVGMARNALVAGKWDEVASCMDALAVEAENCVEIAQDLHWKEENAEDH